MWAAAVGSMVARLALREGFADVSFHVGGRRGWQTIAVAAIFPIVIGLPAYGIAWKAGLASFAPRPRGVAAHLASTSPVVSFVVMLAVAATVGTAFDAARTGGDSSRLHDGASWWVGESGVLTVITMIIAAVVFSQTGWVIPRQLNVRPATGVASSTNQPQSTGSTACVRGRDLIPWRPVRRRARPRHFFSMLDRIVGDRARYRSAM